MNSPVTRLRKSYPVVPATGQDSGSVSSASRIFSATIQAFGAAGVSEDAGLARAYSSIRTLRLADGPDEVHRRAIARPTTLAAVGSERNLS